MDPKQKVVTLFDEFKKFAFKGNVVDLAIGVVIGAAFGKIVDSLVKDVIMPLVSTVLPGEGGYTSWTATINGVAVPYGRFIAELINFLIVAWVLFVFIKKFLGWLMRLRKEETPQTPPLTKDQELLTEIRDLLKKQAGAAPV